MSLPVILSPEARSDYDEAFDWYEAQRPGLGVELAERLQYVFDQIADEPGRYQEVVQGVRRAVVRHFPYQVLYMPFEDRIVILAVFHGKRNPAVWQQRVRPS